MMFVYMIVVEFTSLLNAEHIDYYFKGFIPKFMATGCFSSCNLELDINQHTIVLRCNCDSLEIYKEYVEKFSQPFFAQFNAAFGKEVLSFQRKFLKVLS